MKLGTFRRLATVLLLIGIAAVSATGCVFIPYPVGGYGHYGHDEQDGRRLRLRVSTGASQPDSARGA
jgi:hypothetical protein